MGIKTILSGILILMCLSFTNAQQDYASRFFLGKSYVENGQNELAMEVLKNIANFDSENKFREQAAYFYSIAAIQESQYFQARQMLIQIISRYSYWQEVDEARYLIGLCFFRSQDPVIALDYLSKIKDEKLKVKSENLKASFINTYNDIQTLESLFEKYPQDKIIAFRYAKLLAKDGTTEQNFLTLESLIDIFQFNPEFFNRSHPDQVVIKDKYNISVLLPFKYENVKSRIQYDKNKFAYEFYAGLLQAIDTLEPNHKKLRIRAFDTKGDTNQLAKLLKRRDLKESDLIIGPLLPELSQMTFDFGRQNKIIVVNPFSKNEDYLENNPYAYLFQTTNQHKARLLSQFALDSLMLDSGSKNLLIMENTVADSITAEIYKKYLYTKGYSIDTIITLDPVNRAQFFEVFNDSSELNAFTNMFICNSDRVISGRIISALESSGSEMNVLGHSQWLGYDNVDLDQLERRNVYFTHPDFVNYHGVIYKKFYKNYNFDNMPSFYAKTGFELMNHFGRAILKYGKYFQENLEKEGYSKGYLFSGVDYSNGHFNCYSPFMKVESTMLKTVAYKPIIDYNYLESFSDLILKQNEELLNKENEKLNPEIERRNENRNKY